MVDIIILVNSKFSTVRSSSGPNDTGSIPGGLTATLALHKWRSKIATFKTPLYLWIHELYYENNTANQLVLLSIAYIHKLIMCICVYQ